MPMYADVLARVSAWVKTQDQGFDIWKPRWALAGEMPGAAYPGSGALTATYTSQMRRALNQLADNGTLVKYGSGRNARYYTQEAWQHRQAEASAAAASWAAEREAWRQAKLRLAGHGLTDISGSETAVRLDLTGWEDLLARLDREQEGRP